MADVRAFWGPREESVEQVAVRAEECLEGLQQFAAPAWRRLVSKPASDSPPMPVAGTALRGHLADSVQFTDSPKHPMPELGYSLRGWAQDGSATASFSLNAGGTSSRVPNSCLLLDEGIFAASLTDPDTALQILALLVRTCAPDYALVDTYAFGEPPLRRTKPPVGWLLYLTGAAADAACTLPEAQDWQDGVLVTAAPALTGVDVNEVADLQSRLIDAGALTDARA